MKKNHKNEFYCTLGNVCRFYFFIAEKRALCHNEHTAALLLNFGLGYVLQHFSVVPQFQHLAFYSLLHNLRGCADDTPSSL